MAHIVPAHWQSMSAIGAAQRELETLARLAENLPDDYTVFHGVHWTRIEQGFALFGDIDFAIVSPGGRLLVIEQISGFLRETPDGLIKQIDRKERKVAVGLNATLDDLRQRMTHAGIDTSGLDALLFCPDHRVRQAATAGLAPERIVDGERKTDLAAVIQTILPPDEASPLAGRVKDFLGQILSLVPEIGAIASQAEALYTRLAGGLATWGRQIDCEPHRLRVVGTAGSGKTQLALAVCRDAIAAGRRPAYICFNRPLADHMAQLMPSDVEVATYHQLCDRVLYAGGQRVDFTQPDAFNLLEAGFAIWLPRCPGNSTS
jgi:hypothetical protein